MNYLNEIFFKLTIIRNECIKVRDKWLKNILKHIKWYFNFQKKTNKKIEIVLSGGLI